MILTLNSENRYTIYCKTGKYIEDILIDDRLSIVKSFLNKVCESSYNPSHNTVRCTLMSDPFTVKDIYIFKNIKLSEDYHIRFLYGKTQVWFNTMWGSVYCYAIGELSM